MRVRQDRGERLIDLVGDRAGKFAEHGDAHQMRHFLALQFGFGLGGLLFGDVDENAAELVRSTLVVGDANARER